MNHDDIVYFGAMVGGAKRMRALQEKIEQAAAVDLPVLIVGETGSGKELVAREIHDRSERAKNPFVALNTGAIPRELIASELFGHVKGAFTGATDAREGRFVEAGRGTLFLDEIGTMEDRVQVSLLRVLENGVLRPVGSKRDQDTHARVIAASNEDLESLVSQGQFRSDLMYRLEVMRIDVPPLREVPEEIPLLAQHFIDEFAEEYERDVKAVSEPALNVFRQYDWPGNIRELRNVIAQGCVTAQSGEIKIEHLSPRFRKQVEDVIIKVQEKEDDDNCGPEVASRVVERLNDTESLEGVFMPFGSTLDDVERVYVTKTLEHCDNNKTRTAKVLGMSRKSLYERLKRWRDAEESSE